MESDGVTVTVVTTGPYRDKFNSRASLVSDSLTLTNDQNSSLIASDLKPDFDDEKYSDSDSVESSSVDFEKFKMHDQSTFQAAILPLVPPASDMPEISDNMYFTIRNSFLEMF